MQEIRYVLLLARLLLPHQSGASHAPSILQLLSHHDLLPECDKPDSNEHVHSIIPNLWDLWNNRRHEFKYANGAPMNFIDIYKNLMELSAKTVQKLQ